MKTIVFFGIYDPGYSRNRILTQGFKANGWEVLECRADARSGFLRKYIELYRQYKLIKAKKIDLVLVAFPGQTVALMAKVLFKKKKIVFDMFLSLYDSNVYDRKIYGKYSPKALKDWLLDWHSCLLSDVVLLDTNEHIKYVSKQFHISDKKMIRVPIGADTTVFHPIAPIAQSSVFTCHFHGMFIPLQGIEYILGAAKILLSEPIRFVIVGSGQEHAKALKTISGDGLTNVTMVGKVPFEKIPEYIAASDVCLGIFGSTDKAMRVIPNKVYEYIAMNKPVITADTKAIREFFVDGVDMMLCTSASAESLAQTIRNAYTDRVSSIRIAQTAYDKSSADFSPKMIVAKLLNSSLIS